VAGLIQRVPVGVLQFLGLRNGGETPKTFGSEVLPILDTTPFYAAEDLQQTIQTDAATNVAGSGSFVDVPAGEAWLIVAVGGIWSTFTAGSVFRAAIHLGFQPNLVPVATMEQSVTISAGATDQFRIPFVPPQPLVLPSGCRIGTVLLQSMANNATPQTRVLYMPLRR